MQADARIDPESLERDNDRDIDSLADKTSFLRKVCAALELHGLMLKVFSAFQASCYPEALLALGWTLLAMCRSPVTSMQRLTPKIGFSITWYALLLEGIYPVEQMWQCSVQWGLLI